MASDSAFCSPWHRSAWKPPSACFVRRRDIVVLNLGKLTLIMSEAVNAILNVFVCGFGVEKEFK